MLHPGGYIQPQPQLYQAPPPPPPPPPPTLPAPKSVSELESEGVHLLLRSGEGLQWGCQTTASIGVPFVFPGEQLNYQCANARAEIHRVSLQIAAGCTGHQNSTLQYPGPHPSYYCCSQMFSKLSWVESDTNAGIHQPADLDIMHNHAPGVCVCGPSCPFHGMQRVEGADTVSDRFCHTNS